MGCGSFFAKLILVVSALAEIASGVLIIVRGTSIPQWVIDLGNAWGIVNFNLTVQLITFIVGAFLILFGLLGLLANYTKNRCVTIMYNTLTVVGALVTLAAGVGMLIAAQMFNNGANLRSEVCASTGSQAAWSTYYNQSSTAFYSYCRPVHYNVSSCGDDFYKGVEAQNAGINTDKVEWLVNLQTVVENSLQCGGVCAAAAPIFSAQTPEQFATRRPACVDQLASYIQNMNILTWGIALTAVGAVLLFCAMTSCANSCCRSRPQYSNQVPSNASSPPPFAYTTGYGAPMDTIRRPSAPQQAVCYV